MTLKRQIYKRSETFERVKLKFPSSGEEITIAEKRFIEGERFICTISRSDQSGVEQLFRCEIYGKIEIEQRPTGELRMIGNTAETTTKALAE